MVKSNGSPSRSVNWPSKIISDIPFPIKSNARAFLLDETRAVNHYKAILVLRWCLNRRTFVRKGKFEPVDHEEKHQQVGSSNYVVPDDVNLMFKVAYVHNIIKDP